MNMEIDVKYFNFPNPEVRVVGVYNFKGGVGKTFSTMNLSHKFATQEFISRTRNNILLIDLDGQCSLSFALNRKLQEIRASVNELKDTADTNEIKILQDSMIKLLSNEDKYHIVKVWRNEISPEPEPLDNDELKEKFKTEHPNLFLINGSPHIHEVESWMTSRKDTLTDRFRLINLITKIADVMKVKYVIIDLNPGNTLLNQSILARTNRLLVPMFLDEGSVNSVKVLFSWVYPEARKFGSTVTHAYRQIDRKVKVLFNKYKKQFPRHHDDDDERLMTTTSRFWAGVVRELLKQQFDGSFMELSPNMESQVMNSRNVTHFNAVATTEQWKIDELNNNLEKLIKFIKKD